MKNRRDRSIESIPRLFRSFSKGIFTEVNCRNLSESILDELAQRVYQFVQNQSFSSRLFDGHPLEFLSADSRRSTIYKSFVNETFLERNVYRIYLGDFDEKSTRKVDLHSMNIILYKTTDENPFVHELIVEGEKQSFGCRWKLPHQQFESIWESLEFDLPIKSQLINYVFTLIRFDKAKIDRNIVQCNQTILLYGPPGRSRLSIVFVFFLFVIVFSILRLWKNVVVQRFGGKSFDSNERIFSSILFLRIEFFGPFFQMVFGIFTQFVEIFR